MMKLISIIVTVFSILVLAGNLFAQPGSGTPSLEYFYCAGIPLDEWDAPTISNNWLWAQATFDGGILNMEDVRPGAQSSFDDTIQVLVNGEVLATAPKQADWWPNAVRRRAVVEGVEFTGTVKAAKQRYALLSCLEMHNTTMQTKTLSIELRFVGNDGLHGVVESPSSRPPGLKGPVYRFDEYTLKPGEQRSIHTVNLFRSDSVNLDEMLRNFQDEWTASDDYWEALLEDAYTPGPGPYLTGGVPLFETDEVDAKRFYNFGVLNALLLMKNDLDNGAGSNLYVTAMADASFGTYIYMWDVGYASEILAMLDPEGLRAIIERWASFDIHTLLAVAYEDPSRAYAPGTFYAGSSSMFAFSVWNYVNYTGDYELLDEEFNGRTILQLLRSAADWHKTRPQWNGVAHYGDEANLFDEYTVENYKHYVAAPNAADVWLNRMLASIYETRYDDARTASELRREADRIALAVIANLYNSNPGYEGTWKQRHEDGKMSQERHSWDFMLAGSFMQEDLSQKQKQEMRNWFVNNLVQIDSEDTWVVAQDPRDGNNGEHQMEHNGRGAYPAWPYHDGWALKSMGFHEDTIKLLEVIDGVTKMGAIGQGHTPQGRRCRSNWANIAGASAAAYLLHNVFDIWPDLGELRPHPNLVGFDSNASFTNVPVRGVLYRVSGDGATKTGVLQGVDSHKQQSK
jgi:hypothetical protein